MSDRMYVMQEREITADAASCIRMLLDSIDGVLKREQEAAQATADRNDERTPNGDRVMAFAGLPEELRWRVMVLGCSVEDLNFWVRHDPETPADQQWYVATEIETGCDAYGISPRDALDNYFASYTRFDGEMA